MKRAKIVCTIGPASAEAATLAEMQECGMDVARMNFSHGSHEEHGLVYEKLRKLGRDIAVMQDLQGPKIRLGKIAEGEIALVAGDAIVLTSGPADGTGARVHVTYPQLASDVEKGDSIYVNDGTIHLEAVQKKGDEVRCRVIHGGVISSHKGVNLPGVKLSSPALTPKDRDDLEYGLSLGVDYVALSFVRKEEEVLALKKLVREKGSTAAVISKIEKREALESLDGIIDASDGIMIARGDLGVEVETENVPILQKSIIEKCLEKGKPVITATQMLESMVSSERPTRAEASDVANAILDGTDAVMLSEETATGSYPALTVETMRKIIEKAESYQAGRSPDHFRADKCLDDLTQGLTDAASSGAVDIARNVGASAIAALTHSGRTARLIARRRPGVPVVALTDSEHVVNQMSLVWGVRAIHVSRIEETEKIFAIVRELLSGAGFKGRVVVTAGIPTREKAATNTVHVIDV